MKHQRNRLTAWVLALSMCLSMLPTVALAETHTHSYTLTEEILPTCVEDGKKTYTCSCGDSYTEFEPAVGHFWAGTMEIDGVSYFVCERCGEITRENWLDCGTFNYNLDWTLYTDGALYISGSGNMYWDSSSTAPWFEYCEDITSVSIGSGVTSIERIAFYGCCNVTSVSIGSTVTSLGQSAFEACSSLTELTLPDSVTTIGEYAFADSGLVTLIIPDSVTSIGDYAFFLCTALTDIYYAGSEEEWAAIVGDNNSATLKEYGVTIHYNSTGPDVEEDVDYTWIFCQDNFNFINSTSYFGSGSFYIEDEMFYSYIDPLDNTIITQLAFRYGAYSKWLTYESEETTRTKNFLKNNLIKWDGSCYGMAVVAGLIKTGNLSAEDLGAATTYELEPIKKDENTTLESIINLFQIQSVLSVYACGLDLMWECAVAGIPFMIYMEDSSTNEAHAVVCYGAETGNFLVSTGALWWSEENEYTMRMLVYDPNSTKEEYIYISDDFGSAETSCDDSLSCNFDTFGYFLNGTAEIVNFDIPHYIYLNVDNMVSTDYWIYSADGSYTEISDGAIIDGTMDASIVWTVASLADGEEIEAENEIYTVCLSDDADYYKIIPAEGETLDALLTYNDFSVGVSGRMESATIYADGTVELTGAEENLAINVTLNDSKFDYVSIVGDADGDISLQINDKSIIIAGDLYNYVVENMDNDCETSALYVSEDTDVEVLMQEEAVVAYVDLDNNGTYETELDHTHYYTYEDNGDGTHTAVCIGEDSSYTENHSYVNGVCDLCGASSDSTHTHSYTATVTKAATCTTAGVKTYTCTVCGATKTETIPATGHTWNNGEVTTPATRYTEGEKTYTCTVCGATRTETIAVLTGSAAQFLFTDVTNTAASYYTPVYWAYDYGITKGTSATAFSPSATCTRAQFVTFLWRLAGEPEPASSNNPFTDVTNTSASYYKAVLWAVEQGVTKGTSATTFSPSQTITRAQAVTFLYRYAGEPAVSASSSFTDVTNTSASYYKAVIWAVEKGITNGTTSTTFSPSNPCTRGQMVTFLYRFAVEPLTT